MIKKPTTIKGKHCSNSRKIAKYPIGQWSMKYSGTCVTRPPLLPEKSGLIRQVVFSDRFKIHVKYSPVSNQSGLWSQGGLFQTGGLLHRFRCTTSQSVWCSHSSHCSSINQRL